MATGWTTGFNSYTSPGAYPASYCVGSWDPSSQGRTSQSVKLTIYLYLVPRLRMFEALPSIPIHLHDVYLRQRD